MSDKYERAEQRRASYYDKLVPLMEKKGVTPYRVMKDLRWSWATLPRWKDGTAIPKVEKMCQLAEYFDVPYDYFLEIKVTY